MLTHERLFIGGSWVTPATHETIDVVSPHTEEVIARVPAAAPADVDRAVTAARKAFDEGPWPRTPPADRAAALARLADIYESRAGEMAGLISAEMGSPISFAHGVQTPWPLSFLRYYADLGARYVWEEERAGMMGPVTVRREPVGVVAAIVPWNVPQFLIMAKLAPALVAGCSIVLKPAPETPLDSYLLAEIVEQAGLPPGVVNIVAGGRQTGEHLVSHPGVDKVAFTGSTDAGRRVGEICGRQVKRCSLELGGKSAAIILDDADLAETTQWLRTAPMGNSGQTCVAQTRVLVSRRRHDEVLDSLAEAVGQMSVGDPADPTTEVGPLAARRQQERVEGYLRLGEQEGAKAIVGGAGSGDRGRGWYVAPTVFAGVDNGMRIAREEIFGPVLTVIPYEDEEEAIRIADDSPYGLGGAVWTGDVEHGMDVARRVRTGSFGVNMMYMFDPATPFGGYKASGVGRELGPEGLESYVEIKSIARPA